MEVIGQALIQYDESPYKNRAFGHRHRRTSRMPCEHEVRDWGRASTSQRIPRMASSHQNAKDGQREACKRSFQASEDPACEPLDLRPTVSRAMRESIPVVKVTQEVVLCYDTFRA